MSAPGGASNYDAFIAYSQVDAGLAQALSEAILEFGRRVGHPLRVFLDRSFPPGPDFMEGVWNALSSSRYLIVLVSPASAESGFVTDIVRWWVDRHGLERIIPVLADGDPLLFPAL